MWIIIISCFFNTPQNDLCSFGADDWRTNRLDRQNHRLPLRLCEHASEDEEDMSGGTKDSLANDQTATEVETGARTCT